MLDERQNIKCPWCDGKSTAKEWDDNTYSECTSRAMRRAYTPIYKESTFRRGAGTFYKCPKCELWSRGSQLAIVDTDDKRLLRLGREPVIWIMDRFGNRVD